MLTWWLNGHDPSVMMKLQKATSETKVSQKSPDTCNNNTITNVSALYEKDNNAHATENSRNTSNRRQRRNGNVTIGMEPDSRDKDVSVLSDDNSDRDYLFTPVELPGQVT